MGGARMVGFVFVPFAAAHRILNTSLRTLYSRETAGSSGRRINAAVKPVNEPYYCCRAHCAKLPASHGRRFGGLEGNMGGRGEGGGQLGSGSRFKRPPSLGLCITFEQCGAWSTVAFNSATNDVPIHIVGPPLRATTPSRGTPQTGQEIKVAT